MIALSSFPDFSDIITNKLLLSFTEVEVNNGGYLPSHKAVREIFTNTEVNNNIVLVYTTQVEQTTLKTTISATINRKMIDS